MKYADISESALIATERFPGKTLCVNTVVQPFQEELEMTLSDENGKGSS